MNEGDNSNIYLDNDKPNCELNKTIKFDYNWKTISIGIWLLILAIGLITLSYFVWFTSNPNIKQLRELINIGISGGLGGTVYCMRGFYQQLGKKEFDNIWFWWYIFRPVISIIVGTFSYFMISGGVLVLSTQADPSKSFIFYSSISFIIGLTFSRFMDKVYQLAEVLFTPKSN